MTLEDLRRFAVWRSLFAPVTLKRAIDRLGFVQADPIRAPARAQDLTLRHRVKGYRAGDLERRFAALDIEEEFLVNYGFVSRTVHALMHPRVDPSRWLRSRGARAVTVLDFIRERGEVHPRQVDEHFARGTVTNYWGGSSSATTHLLVHMHYQGVLRVTRREKGIRIYAAREAADDSGVKPVPRDRVDALIDVIVRKYAPLPGQTLSSLVYRLRYAVPQWRRELKPGLLRAKRRLAHARLDGVDWYWPHGEDPQCATASVPRLADARSGDESVRLLAPFDPIVWDRLRFELFWGWAYRFEAYTPLAKRKLGYYALPLLFRDRVIGWGNLSVKDETLTADFGYVTGRPPRERAFREALDAELAAMGTFLRLPLTS
jgi:uncharacterized protein YcaQ